MTEICAPVEFGAILERGRECDLKIIFWEEEKKGLKKALSMVSVENPRSIMIMIGPEGGFSRDEVAMAKSKGFISASLGARALRSETATLAACALVQYIFGGME